MNEQTDNRLHVVHVAGGLSTGGAERLLVEFGKFADRSRFRLSFVSLDKSGPIGDELIAQGWEVLTLNKGAGFKPGVIRKLARYLRRSGADVVHTHNTAAYLYGVPAARLGGVRCIVHTRHGQRFQESVRSTRAFRWLSRLATYIVAVSEDSARLTLGEGIAPTKVRTILNGIDLDHFSHSGPRPDGPAVLVARLSPEKGVDNLIRACAEVARECPDFRLVIAGDGSTRDGLEDLTRELRLGATVQFLGEHRDVAGLLESASMFVLPSLTEGVSLTLLEAMARGLPVIATRVGGNPEVVDDGRTGLLVEAGEPEDLAAAIVSLWRDQERINELGRAGRVRVEKLFDIRRMVSDYENLYSPESAVPPDQVAVATVGDAS